MKDFPNWKNIQSYLIIGGQKAKEELINFLNGQGIDTTGQNPDYISVEAEKSFSIDQSRELISRHSMRKISDGPRIFLIRFSEITHEAQNSLLKLIEEPAKDNYIFIITDSDSILLPTIKSRLVRVNNADFETVQKENKYLERAEEFFKANKKRRLEMVSKLIGDIDDENITRNDLREFVKSLEIVVSKELRKDAKAKASLEAIYLAEKYMQYRSASRKMIMEYLAIMI